MKRKKVIVSFLVILCIIFVGGMVYYFNKDIKIVLRDDLTVNINDSVTYEDFIVKSSKGQILSQPIKLDTSSLGKVNIALMVKNIFGIGSYYDFSINVVDREKPVIVFNPYIEVTQGSKVDLLSSVIAKDNYDESVDVSIDGTYDLNIPGEYKIYYIAIDSSGNEAREEASLVVKEKPSYDSNGIRTNMTDRSFTTSKGFDAIIKDGVLYIDGYLIANKSYYLPSTYGDSLTSETMNAFNSMKNDAKELGMNIYISSGFRSYSLQKTIYNGYVSRNGQIEADTYSARPGHSEHQSGLAFDVNDISQAFANTKEGIWLNENAYKYGFILRYPKGKTDETGYIYEPWHFRYVGEELATKLYNDGDWITMEDYFGITSEYDF